MGKKDNRIDTYIDKARPFAVPILKKLRELIHKGIPEVEETIKWGMPFFEYKGPVCNMASFKEHATLGFWKYKLIKDAKGYLQDISNKGGEAMGNLGRMTGIDDLPPDKVIIDFLKQAKKLNDDDLKVLRTQKTSKAELVIPDYIIRALKKNKVAEKTFNSFPYSHKKEYIEWVTEAKTEPTRNKRLENAIEWMTEGKSRNWKYMKK